MTKSHGWWWIVGGLLLLLAGRDLLVRPPSLALTVAPGEFDTPRALSRLARILGDQRPHPVDSDANDSVRARLLAELRALGLKPRVQDAFDCSSFPKRPSVSCARVRNVIVPIGSGPGKRLLLNAHYDSTPVGPGAADDGIGVATLLEVAAQLQQRPIATPVTLLFNEGEEWGLNGAAAFLEQAPEARTIDRLINIEARGVSGPALMFETSRPNGPAIAAYARATKRPFANSLTADFATLVPNYTDVVTFADAQWTTLSYAIIGNETRYHSPGDTVDRLDPATLHHMGSEVLAATRGFSTEKAPKTAYTDLFGLVLVKLPLALAVALAMAIPLALALLAVRRKALLKPLAVLLATTLLAIAATLLFSEIAALIRPGDYWRAHPRLAHLAADLTTLTLLVALWPRRADPLAAWLLVALTGAALTLALPGASILFLIAPLLALAGLARSWRPLLWIAAILHAAMIAQLLALIDLLLIDGPLAAGAPLVALAALPLLALAPPPRRLAAALALGAAALWGAALLAPRSSADRPAQFTLDYVRDDVAGRSDWAIATKQAPLPADWPDAARWTQQSLSYNRRPRWVSSAPLLDIPAARLTRLANQPRGPGRTVTIRIDSKAPSWTLILPSDARLAGAGVPGTVRPVAQMDGTASVRCSGRSCDGLRLELAFPNRKPVEARLVATSPGLPPQAAPLIARRPERSHPQYLPESRVRVSGFRF